MRLRSQFLIQLSGGVLSALAFVGLTPVLLSSLGLERYGVLLLVLGFLIYAGLAEFGLGGATSREIAAATCEDRARIFGNAIVLSIGFAGVGGTLFSLLALPAISSLLVDDIEIVEELTRSGWALFALGAASILANVPKGVLFGVSGFVSLNIIDVLGVVGILLAPAIYATSIGKDLPGLIAVTATAYGLTLLAAFAACLAHRTCPELRYDGSIARTLLSYGSWSTSSAILHRLTNSLDRILLSAFSGSSAVPIFAIPQGALNRSQMLSNALLSAVFPRLVRSPKDESLIETCYGGMFLLSPLFVVGVIIIDPMLKVWLGDEFADQAHLAAILLAIATWLDMMGRVPYTLLQARSELSQETRISGQILIPNILLLVLAVKFFGVAGAAAIAILRAGAFVVLRGRATYIKPFLNRQIILHSLVIGLASAGSLYLTAGGNLLFCLGVIVLSLGTAIWLNFANGQKFVRSFFPNFATAQDKD